MLCDYACHSSDHTVSRRGFLGRLLAGATGAFGLGSWASPALGKHLLSSHKRVMMIYLHGGVSQLETWDPKPGTDTGGPFRAIPTSVPGIHICELLPHTAKHMHRLAIVRGLNTAEDDHGKGDYIMHTGRRQDPAVQYPHLGAVCAKLLNADAQPLPGYIQIFPGGGSGSFSKQDSAFLGPKYASVGLPNGAPPINLFRPGSLTHEADRQREELRQKLSQRFARSRRTAQTEAYLQSFDQAAQFVQKGYVFDIDREDPKLADQYGRHDFGRHMLLARRLLENGATFVKVMHANYDTHHENFDFHIEQLGEFDRTFATFIEDLCERGLWDSTLVIVMSEFGRTPRINHLYGRDHWSKAWSVALGGCGIRGGSVAGKTNANGTAVVEGEVNAGHLFHTYYQALGLDSKKQFYPGTRPVPLADPATQPIREILL